MKEVWIMVLNKAEERMVLKKVKGFARRNFYEADRYGVKIKLSTLNEIVYYLTEEFLDRAGISNLNVTFKSMAAFEKYLDGLSLDKYLQPVLKEGKEKIIEEIARSPKYQIKIIEAECHKVRKMIFDRYESVIDIDGNEWREDNDAFEKFYMGICKGDEYFIVSELLSDDFKTSPEYYESWMRQKVSLKK